MTDASGMREGIAINEYRPSASLRFLYNTAPGRLVLKVMKRRGVSRFVGRLLSSRLSACTLKCFCRSANIDLSEAVRTELSKYKSYNDLFTRILRPECRPIDRAFTHLISPCDGRITAYAIDRDSCFTIKGGQYSIGDLVGDFALAEQFVGGICLIFRLEVCDYHRYCYIDDGEKGEDYSLGSELHTVQPIALKRYNFYKRNYRVCSVLQTRSFGTVAQIEVGAMCVGRINNHMGAGSFARGEEKGLFELGGSTIVVLLKENTVRIDADILSNTAEQKETPVRMGERVGSVL